MTYATRNELFGDPPQRRFADVTLHGRNFRLRSLMAGEANRITCRHLAAEDEDARASALSSLPARYIVQCVVDADGNRILSDTDVVTILDTWDAAFTADLAAACQKHCGATEDSEKNSVATPS